MDAQSFLFFINFPNQAPSSKGQKPKAWCLHEHCITPLPKVKNMTSSWPSFNNIATLQLSCITACPEGFSWLDHQGCVAVVEDPLPRDEALAKCRQNNPNANLMLPKTAAGQAQLEGLVGGMPESGGSYFIGMTRVDGHWLWDDGSPVFVTSEIFLIFLSSQSFIVLSSLRS